MRTLIAIIAGLSVASGVFWYQNPDLELKAPEGLLAQVEERSSALSQVSESFAAIAATSTPKPTTATAIGNARSQAGDAPASAYSVDRVSELEKKVHEGINLARTTHGASPQLKWDHSLRDIARAHSEDMTQRGYYRHRNLEGLGSNRTG